MKEPLEVKFETIVQTMQVNRRLRDWWFMLATGTILVCTTAMTPMGC